MTKDEALDLALEALELALSSHGILLLSDPPQDPWKTRGVENKSRQAITAIKQARALDKMADNARELGLDYEPVWDNLPSNKDVEEAMRMKRFNQITTPPAAQRQWVEVEQIKWEGDRLIAKLKENT